MAMLTTTVICFTAITIGASFLSIIICMRSAQIGKWQGDPYTD